LAIAECASETEEAPAHVGARERSGGRRLLAAVTSIIQERPPVMRRILKSPIIRAGVMLLLVLAPAGRAQSDRPSVPLYDNLGDHHYAISTEVPLAQQYFDQGLRLYYAFNHAEAIRAFEQATRLDPDCAMCYWGIALSYGPNINAPMDSAAGVAAYAAIVEAAARTADASPVERALIGALAARYVPAPPAERAALDSAYARAMERVVRAFPEDPEAATLYAESLMDLSPWNYWTPAGEPRPDTPALLAQLERVTAAYPDHPGANHFYIHTVEPVDPERALGAAERLAGLMPGAGHLVHMPGHIYVRVGRYTDVIEINQHAVHADEAYIRDQSPSFGIYVAGYYPHNYDFLAFAASMIGRSEQAIAAAEKMVTIVPQDMLRVPGLTFLQHHMTRHLQLKVRFARWDEILEEPAPADDLAHARAMWFYARGRALAARGKLEAAEEALAQVRAAAQAPELANLRMEFNTSGAVLGIATEVLAGHIAAAHGRYAAAIAHLRNAAKRERNLLYGEPPEWTVPVRHELGAVLLAAGRPAEAEEVFRASLDRFPKNGWSLAGLAQALRAQGRTAEADRVAEAFRDMWETADVGTPAYGRTAG
jgi:tetratricopeptide (TPR) repeat protein